MLRQAKEYGFSDKQLVMYKKIVECATGRYLAPEEVFSEPVVAFHSTKQFQDAGLRVVDNTEEEILEGAEEMIAMTTPGASIRTKEHERMLAWYRSLQPDWSVAGLSDSRPAICALETLWSMRSAAVVGGDLR